MSNKKAQSLITITIIIAIVALLLRVAIENIIRINITQSESNALSTLKLISTALENYAKSNVGVFPASLSVLTQTQPPYIDKDYIVLSPLKGYRYAFTKLDASSYSCRATPLRCNLTGNRIFTMTTGGLLVSEECAKKEQ